MRMQFDVNKCVIYYDVFHMLTLSKTYCISPGISFSSFTPFGLSVLSSLVGIRSIHRLLSNYPHRATIIHYLYSFSLCALQMLKLEFQNSLPTAYRQEINVTKENQRLKFSGNAHTYSMILNMMLVFVFCRSIFTSIFNDDLQVVFLVDTLILSTSNMDQFIHNSNN